MGTVYDQASGKPLSGANVHLTNTTLGTTTNSLGEFSIPAVDPGSYLVRAAMMGYELEERPVEVAPAASSKIEFRLQSTVLRINKEIVVTAVRDETNTFDVAHSVSSLDSRDLSVRLPRSTPEALMETTGVWMQKTNHGSGSPFLRGLVGNQVLVLVDGIRLNNSTFRYGPNQYLNSIDPWQIERIEVLRGSGSVQYGSDALGGVINIITKQPQFYSDGVRLSADFSSKYMSSGMEKSGRTEIGLCSPRVAILGGLSIKNFGDLRAGGDLGVEAPTGYDEVDGDFKAMIRLSTRQLLTISHQTVHQKDVPRFDQVAQRGYRRYSFDPQIQHLSYAKFQSFFSSHWINSFNLIASFQRSIEQRVMQKQGSDVITTEKDDVGVYGISLEIHSQPSAHWAINSGLDYYHDRVDSWRKQTVEPHNTSVVSRGLYPDHSKASSLALFVLNSVELGKVKFDFGARFNQYVISISDEAFENLKIKPSAVVGSASVMYKIHPNHRLIAAISQGFRAPNINDVSTLGGFDFGIEVPSTDLSPEKTLNFELGLKTRTNRIASSIALYRTNLFNLIDRIRSTYNGSEYYEGQRVYKKQNVDKAYIHGCEADFELQAHAQIVLSGNLVYTFGQKTSTDEPMRRIPPLNGQAALRWQSASRFWAEMRVLFADKQDRLAQGDIDDHRIAKGGTPGWQIVNLNGGYSFGPHFELIFGLQNVFDKAYRIHSSGVDGYGRSFWLGMNVKV